MPLTRRRLFRHGAGLTFGMTLGQLAHAGRSQPQNTPASGPARILNAYVHIGPDDSITIYHSSAEMGQGVMTALPLIVAEELDADWNQVTVAPSPPTGEEYGDPVFLNMIYTVASRSVSTNFERLRIFGAQARMQLLHTAAGHWGVALQELRTEPSLVVHDATGRRLAYGAIAALPRPAAPPPHIGLADLKDPARFRLIGSDVKPRALEEKVRGSLAYSIDVAVPGMLHAAVIRAPMPGATIGALDDTGAAGAQGVIGIYRRDATVAVVAHSFHEALSAKGKLRVEWTPDCSVAAPDSDLMLKEHDGAARDLSRGGLPWDRAGEPEAGFKTARRVVERAYHTDHMYHGGMEPLNAMVRVNPDGTAAEVWAGTQAPWYTVQTVARMTGVDAANVVLHRSPMGGAFGRRSVYAMDFVEDAAWLAAQLRKPVKVTWDREEDLKLGYFRPMSGHFLRARLEPSGQISAWHHRVACEDPVRKHEPLLWEAWHQAPLIGMLGSEHANEDGSPLDHAYDLPTRLVEYIAMDSGVRVYAMRGVGAMPNKFAIESFVDELALETGSDPVAFRLRLLHRSDRARRVLETAATIAAWDGPRPGRGLGVAYSHYTNSLIACVVEIEIDRATGGIDVTNVWIAVDCGIVVQPGNVVAQIEGGAIYGLSNALGERITFKDGAIQQSNFHDYPLLGIGTAPDIHVRSIPSMEPPTGVGEIGTVIVSGALANAFASLTGRRLRHLPLSRERVLQALAAPDYLPNAVSGRLSMASHTSFMDFLA